ncbi:MAG: leucine-rich repeat protein [Lachnospiraceae bacterium]|nr:leucine-rich repeat protein [Lachnospiraceae bacterium]
MKKMGFAAKLIIILAFVLPFGPGSVNVLAFEGEDLTFSNESGYYAGAFSLTISGEGVSRILYTLDGSEPTEGSSSTKEYTGPVKVENLKGKNVLLSTDSNAYKFTDNGWANVPQASRLERATIVRAVGIRADGTKTRVSTKSYFIANNIKSSYSGCAVMSIVTDPDNLLDDDKGIYVGGRLYEASSKTESDLKELANFMQSGKEWERPAFIEFFDGGNTPLFSTGAGIRIHGGYSRRNQQKSFNIYFRADYEYGEKNLKGYELIPDATVQYDDETGTHINKTLKKFANVMLRNGGNDADITKFQDMFIQGMVTDKDFTTQGARPCMLYLNGEFWGLYNLTEKYSDKYIQNKFGVDNKNVIAYKELELDEGEDPDGAAYNELMGLGDLDMTKQENYDKFLKLVDIDSFIDYYATEVYINNNDWWSGCNAKTPYNNLMFWRVADPALEVNEDGGINPYADGRWRYMLYDTEWSMGIYNSYQAGAEYDSIKYHALGIPDSSYDTDYGRTEANGSPVFTAVFKNPDFRKRFATALLDIRNYNFEYNRACAELDRLSNLYSPLMDKHRVRWNTGNISGGVNTMKNFLSRRPAYVLTMLESNYPELTSSKRVNVTVNSNAADTIIVNTVNPEVSPYWFQGVYYREYPVSVNAPQVDGYTFSRWDVTGGAAQDASSPDTQITLTGTDAKITAMYKDENGAEPTVAPTPVPTPKPTNKPWGWGGSATATPKPQSTPKPNDTPKPDVSPVPVIQTPTASPDVVKAQDGIMATDGPDKGSVQKETVFTVKNIKYKVAGSDSVIVSAPVKKTLASVSIPAKVTYGGKTYKVTGIAAKAFRNNKKLAKITLGKNIASIGKNAFSGCMRLKKINLLSIKIKAAGKSCFKSVNGNAVITVPRSKYKFYVKLLKKSGLGKGVRYKTR